MERNILDPRTKGPWDFCLNGVVCCMMVTEGVCGDRE